MISLAWRPARYIQPLLPRRRPAAITISNINSTWPAALCTEGGRKGGKEGEFFIRLKRMASRCMLDWRLRDASCLNVKALCRTRNVISHDLTSWLHLLSGEDKFLSGKSERAVLDRASFWILDLLSTYYPQKPFSLLERFQTRRRICTDLDGMGAWKYYHGINRAGFFGLHVIQQTTQLCIFFWDYEWISPCTERYRI